MKIFISGTIFHKVSKLPIGHIDKPFFAMGAFKFQKTIALTLFKEDLSDHFFNLCIAQCPGIRYCHLRFSPWDWCPIHYHSGKYWNAQCQYLPIQKEEVIYITLVPNDFLWPGCVIANEGGLEVPHKEVHLTRCKTCPHGSTHCFKKHFTIKLD